MNLQLANACLDVEILGDVLIARFPGSVSLNGPTAGVVSEQLASLLSEEGRQRLLVDFGNVQSLTSFMLGQLVTLNRKAQAGGRRFALFNLAPHVREVLEAARLNLVMSLYADESAALLGC